MSTETLQEILPGLPNLPWQDQVYPLAGTMGEPGRGKQVSAIRFMIIGFFLAVGWTIAQFLMSIAIPFWLGKIHPLIYVKGIQF